MFIESFVLEDEVLILASARMVIRTTSVAVVGRKESVETIFVLTECWSGLTPPLSFHALPAPLSTGFRDSLNDISLIYEY